MKLSCIRWSYIIKKAHLGALQFSQVSYDVTWGVKDLCQVYRMAFILFILAFIVVGKLIHIRCVDSHFFLCCFSWPQFSMNDLPLESQE